MRAHRTKVLISGAGIAGPAFAHFLAQSGFEVTIVEKAPAPRHGGYLLDVREIGCDVAERMGILAMLEKQRCEMQNVRVVDCNDQCIIGLDPRIVREKSGERIVSILRGELSKIIFDASQQNIRYVFGDVITSMEDHGDKVHVTFTKNEPMEVDYVIGADGENSIVRTLAFGEKSKYEKHCGFYISAFTVPTAVVQEHTMLQYSLPGRRITAYGIPGGKTVIEFVFRQRQMLDFAPQDTALQKDILRQAFTGGDEQCARFLQSMDDAKDFYLDAVTQIRMPKWHAGRVGLIGDAACLASPLSGQGVSLALGGAYVLASAMAKSRENPTKAFTEYERIFRPIAKEIHSRTLLSAGFHIPDTRIGMAIRNRTLRLFARLPSWMFPRRLTSVRLQLPASR